MCLSCMSRCWRLALTTLVHVSRFDCCPASTSSAPTFHFPYLSTLHQRYLVCWAPGSALYLFTCASYRLATWTRSLGVEDRVHCDGSELWVLCKGGRGVGVLHVADVKTAVRELVKLHLHGHACQVCMVLLFMSCRYCKHTVRTCMHTYIHTVHTYSTYTNRWEVRTVSTRGSTVHAWVYACDRCVNV